MEKLRKIFSDCWKHFFLVLLLFSSLSCFSQNVTTRVPNGIGMTKNYDHYVFMLNNEIRTSCAMSFVNDTIHISPYIVNTFSKSLFKAVTTHELAHYYNYVSYGEITKADTLKQDVQTNSYVDPVDWKMPPDLKKIVYKGGDGTSVKEAVIIKKATTLKEGIAAEYAYLDEKLGQRGIDWKPLGQYLNPDYGKYYDIIKVNIIDTDEIKYFCFEITGFFGKF
jgi:hypothetical protein